MYVCICVEIDICICVCTSALLWATPAVAGGGDPFSEICDMVVAAFCAKLGMYIYICMTHDMNEGFPWSLLKDSIAASM